MTSPFHPAGSTYAALPEQGMAKEDIDASFEELRANDKDGRSSFGERWLNDRGLLLDDGALEVAKAAHMKFFTKNNSHGMIMTLERDLVSWVLNLFHAEPGASGKKGRSRLEEGSEQSLSLFVC